MSRPPSALLFSMKKNLILLLLLSTSFVQAQTTIKDSINTYTAKDFRLQYPSQWKLDTSGLMGSTCFIYAPADNAQDKFRENINVVIQDLTGSGIDLEQYKDISEKQLPAMFPDSKLEESAILNANTAQPYYRVRYSFSKNGVDIHISTICFIRNEKAYLVTFSTELARLEQYKKAGEAMLKSFSLIN